MSTFDATDGVTVDELSSFLNLFTRFGAQFNTDADGTVDDLAVRLTNEIESGDRTAQDVFDSLLLQVFQSTGLAQGLSGGDAPLINTDPNLVKDADDAVRIAEDLLAGGRSPEELIRQLTTVINDRRAAGDVRVIDPATGLPIGGGENTTIPGGATLVKITDPTGSDSAVRYAVVYEAFGVEFSFNIGDIGDIDALFPDGERLFDNVRTLNQQQFDNAGFVDSGGLDAAGLVGRDETFQSLIELQMEQAGLGDLPDWMRNSPDAMAIVATGAAQGWDPGRTWVELSSTDAFKSRFTAFDQFAIGGETIQQTLDRLVVAEENLAGALQRFRPNGFEITTDYLQEALARGWTGDQAAGVLQAEKVLLNNPGALENLNAILIASGMEAVDELGLLNAMAGEAPDEVIEAINTAAAGQALREAGFEGVDVESLVDIIDDISAVRTPDDFAALATNLAVTAAENSAELDRNAFGLSREEVVATIFNEDPSSFAGRGRGEVLTLLAKLERERRAAAQGFGGPQAFANQSGDLVVGGLGGF